MDIALRESVHMGDTNNFSVELKVYQLDTEKIGKDKVQMNYSSTATGIVFTLDFDSLNSAWDYINNLKKSLNKLDEHFTQILCGKSST